MKVTVCFDNTRVIVPCGDGELTVLELINRAVSRYRKASQKNTSADVHVHCLQTVEVHAILDIDDLVVDVCDDKDMLIAVYDEGSPKTNNADITNNNVPHKPPYLPKPEEESCQYITSTLSDNDSGVAADVYGLSSNQTSTHTSLNSMSKPPRGIQCNFPQHKNASFRSSVSSNSPTSSPELSRNNLSTPIFSRDMNRKSLSTNHPMLYSWIDQQDKYSGGTYFRNFQEPNNGNESVKSAGSEEIQLDKRASNTVEIKPYTTADGRDIGLVVHSVVEGSYVDRVGELQTADRITEINGISLNNYTNTAAQALYEEALKADDIIKLKRRRSHVFLKDQLPSLYTQVPVHSLNTKVPEHVLKTSKEAPRPIVNVVESQPQEAAIEAPSTPTKDEKSNNKHVFHVNLVKGTDGLGFSITSKDVATSNERAFFVKNVLNRGAAIKDGRVQAGDEIIKVNNIIVSDKSQADVVKLLRTSQGMVILQLARQKNLMIPDELLPTSDKELYNEEKLSGTDSISPAPDNILTLTIPLTQQGSAGLGISVKGKRTELSDEDQGIFVKSVIKGGAAAKDGRMQQSDQLLCINDTSLIGLNNNDAMNVLRQSMESSLEKGSIRIIIGRSSKVQHNSHPNSSHGTSPVRMSSPMSQCESVSVQPQHESVSTQSSNGRNVMSPEDLEAEKQFNEIYLKRRASPDRYHISRNKSYFKAVIPHMLPDSDIEDTVSPQSVSISSTEIPAVQKSRAVYIEPFETNKPLPSYEEVLIRKDSTASSSSSKTDTIDSRTGTKSNSAKFKILPDKILHIPNDQKAKKTISFEKSKSLSRSYDDIQSLDDMSRCMSLASQSSLDSVLVGPNQIPFSRDAFGRSSMSERKGRAHIDATKSEFYNKLKKFKSMEELRASRTSNSNDILQSEFFNNSHSGSVKRSESVDTLISRMDEEEQRTSSSINHGTVLSSSTPWYSTHTTGLRDQGDQKIRKDRKISLDKTVLGFKPSLDVKLRSPKINRKPRRPYSCILDDARTRNILLNDSFKNALDIQTDYKSQSSPLPIKQMNDDKKKKGFLKGISTLLKRKKQKPSETFAENSDLDALDISSKNRNKARPLSMNFKLSPESGKNLKYFQADALQKELVQAKIDELKRKDIKKGSEINDRKEVKKRKSDVGSRGRESPSKVCESPSKGHESPSKSRESPSKGRELPFKGHKLTTKPSLNRWNSNDADAMREKSKQFFNVGVRDSSRSTASSRGMLLQRQSSLPPRAKKDSIEHRVLPRAPADHQSPESMRNGHGTNSAPNSKPGTSVKKIYKYDSLPRKPKQKEYRSDGLKDRRHDVNDPTDNTNFSSISDLTRPGGSVKISHKAQI